MRLSQYYMPVLKEVPAEAQVVSHQLMLRAGMIMQESAGIYSWLPLGLKVLQNIQDIIRQEQASINCHEILMPTLQPADLWKKSGRYDSYGKEMLRVQDRHEKELIYGPTNEEMVTNIMRKTVHTYRQLPLRLYHIQWKFRDEIRPRFGVMRGREFLMKDAYSFDLTEEEARKTYFEMMYAYIRTFQRMGVTVVPVQADTGPIGGDLSHEFHVLAETGESQIFYDAAFHDLQVESEEDLESLLGLYAREETMHDLANCPVPQENILAKRGIEVGHIFYFADKYTGPMDACVTGPDGQKIAPYCGSYGIGVGRMVAAIIEASHDDKGIIWPAEIAPFKLGILNLKPGHKDCDRVAQELYDYFMEMSFSEDSFVLLDDTNDSPGVKFSRMDLIGLPYQIIIGPENAKKNHVELKVRKTGEIECIDFETVLAMLSDSVE